MKVNQLFERLTITGIAQNVPSSQHASGKKESSFSSMTSINVIVNILLFLRSCNVWGLFDYTFVF
jgi:hypothetical protein